MPSRSYSQFCGVAVAMDVLGERWAALVVRELLDGPQRYTDLLNRLPGASTDMLARRLADLEAAGVVRRTTLARPGAAKVYELTDLGRELEPVIHALARWGIRRLVAGDYDDVLFDPRWTELILRAVYSPSDAPERPLRIRLRVGEAVFDAVASRNGLDIQPESADTDVDVEIAGSPNALAELLVNPALLPDRLAQGAISATGAQGDIASALATFHLTPTTG